MSAAEGSNVVVAIKKQAGLGSPASGASAVGIEVLPSTGLAQQVATIESAIMRRSKQRLRARKGSKTVSAAYEAELQLGNLDEIFQAVLGCSAATASFSKTESDFTSCTISGTGTLVTMGSGSLITAGARSGMVAKFTNMSVPGNNAVWFPVLNPTALTFAVPSGFLVDNGTDSVFTITFAKHYETPTTYVKSYYTIEEYLSDIDLSKLGTDMVFNNLQLSAQPDQIVRAAFGAAGRDLQSVASGSAPTFTSPVFPSNASSLVMLDGAIYRDTTLVADLTGLTLGLSSQPTQPKLLTSRIALDTFLAMFQFAGQFTGFVQDFTAWNLAEAETPFSVWALFAENEADPSDFVSVYIGNAAFGGANIPIADNALIQTLPLYGGEDRRGTGYAATTMLISTSAT